MLLGTIALLAAALATAPTAQSPLDLKIISAGERYLSWKAIYGGVPRRALSIPSELGSGRTPVEAVLLSDLQHALGEDRASLILARCADGYLSIYSQAFVARFRPIVVLTLNGLPPGEWPPPGMKDNPGPFWIMVSDELAPGVSQLRDISHKEPWSVVSLEFSDEGKLIGALSKAPPAARWLWINSCASCHAGPPGVPGGTKSGLPFAALQADARTRPDFIRRYVADSRKLNPSAQMPPQPEDTGAALEALIGYLADGGGG